MLVGGSRIKTEPTLTSLVGSACVGLLFEDGLELYGYEENLNVLATAFLMIQ